MSLHPVAASVLSLAVAAVFASVPAWSDQQHPAGHPRTPRQSAGERIDAAYVTGYTWFDNGRRGGRGISHPSVHERAGGRGTYHDPITMAVGHAIRGSGEDREHLLDHRPGTRFYLPHLRRYFVVEDTCGEGPRPQRGPCHDLSSAPDGATTWLDVWVGGDARSSRAKVRACAAAVTDGSRLHTAVRNPPPGLPVVRGPLFARGHCTELYPPLPTPSPTPTATPTSTSTPTSTPTPTGSGTPTASQTGTPGSPLAGWQLYVDPDSPAARQADTWALQGRHDDAALVDKIAARPRSVWIVDPSSLGAADRALDAARGSAVTLVLYHLPHRDCGSWSGGGAADAAAYRRLVGDLARVVGERRAIVVVEPDAVPLAVGGCAGLPDPAARYALIAEAVATLGALPQARVYLDAGHPGWLEPSRLVEPLRAAGLASADGLSLNVSNFATTSATTAYGERLSERLGGAHFVIDTSRNGNGPLVSDPTGPVWCNPAGRALGSPPTVDTGHPLVDAWLWVKPPGESDGSCRAGEPPAGSWWPAYALELARNAAW